MLQLNDLRASVCSALLQRGTMDFATAQPSCLPAEASLMLSYIEAIMHSLSSQIRIDVERLSALLQEKLHQ